MKKLFALTLALGLLSAPAFAVLLPIVDNVTNAAKNNPVATGLIALGLLSALNSDDKVTAATATATATSTSTSTSTATK
jgi:hypothetical protein